MIKSIALLICLFLITSIGWSQEFNLLSSSPGENTHTLEDNWKPIDSQHKINWRERSVGAFFMPIPLNIESIEIIGSKESSTIGNNDDIFNIGFGVNINYDFNESGSGLGNITYFALIRGASESELQAYDFFTALKYDITFGPLSKFELSPLLGLGNLAFLNTKKNLYLGNSLYFSGGARITVLAARNLFLGADIQTTPLIFNPKKLLGVNEQVDPFLGEIEDAQINFSFFAQINLSIRYNLF